MGPDVESPSQMAAFDMVTSGSDAVKGGDTGGRSVSARPVVGSSHQQKRSPSAAENTASGSPSGSSQSSRRCAIASSTTSDATSAALRFGRFCESSGPVSTPC